MDLATKYLKVGSSVNIKRTDGRIHSAIIASINDDQRCVTVEWFEQGETKGKDISMAIIESLNPEITILKSGEEISHPPAFHKLQKDSSASSDDHEEEDEDNGDEEKFMVQPNDDPPYSDDEFNSNQFSTDTTIAPNPTCRMEFGINNGGGVATSQSFGNVATMSNGGGLIINNENTMAKESKIPTARTTMSQIPSVKMEFAINNGSIATSQSSSNVGATGHSAATIMNSENTTIGKESNLPVARTTVQNPRRINVVREVEKLRKNREERRQRQAEEKEAKEAFLKMDPGNPHWELLNMILEYRKGLEMKPLSENDLVEDHLITVCVRKRPLSKKEIVKKEVDVITIPSKNQLIIHEPKNKVDLTRYLENQLFRFDYAFDETCSNELVYRYTAQPLISTIFEGGFATCFAYGQTGSGKTHTMSGAFKPGSKEQDCHKGIYALVAADIFRFINSSKYRHLDLVVSSSFFEIYSSKVFDLLNEKSKLRILEDGKQQVQVVGLTEKVVTSTEEVLNLIQKGNQARTSGQTFANVNSSRSHAVFQIYLRRNNDMTKVHGKFSLIDLAGNERGADTSSANRQTRMEGAEINKSLLALKECIRALGRRGAHLPFRVSKLTQVLRDSFVGSNSKTCMIAMISPGVSSCEYTLNTLRYANRMKELGCGDLETASGGQNNGLTDFQPELMEEHQGLLELRSFSETDMPPEMLNFHQVLSELQAVEDNMLECHKHTVEATYSEYLEAIKCLRATETVEYDQEAYCKKWEQISKNMLSMWSRAKEYVDEYKSKLAAEEQLSRKTSKRK